MADYVHWILPIFLCLGYVAAQQQCFVPGECTESNLVNALPAVDVNNCLELCKNTPECAWFTFVSYANFCELFTNCLELAVDNCVDCISGEKECEAPKCDVIGLCQGNLDHSEPRPNKDACLQACKDSPGCGWYSYNVETTICLEFTTCEIDSSSTDFISGQVSCEVSTTTLAPTTPTTTTLPAPDTYGNMVVVAGLPGTESEMSEVYKVSGSEVTSCGSIGKNGAFAWGVVGGYLEGDQAVMVCGGPTSKACYSLPEGQETEMSEVRHYAAAVVVENQLWISGGEEDGSAKSSIETVSFSRRGLSGTTVDLPAPLSKHCAVLLKSKNAVMIIGGSSNGQDSDKTYFFDLSSQSFSDGPSLSSARHSHMCTAFTDGGQEKVAVVGGEGKDSVEILDVATETWTAGPSLSSNLCCGVLVQAENGAILAGGFDGNSNVDSMQALNCDVGSCNWSGVSAKLGFPRSQGVGVLIPDTLANC